MTIIVTGPENSGSKFCARIIAHVLGVASFSDWRGYGWADSEEASPHRVLHRSTPFAGDNVIDAGELIQKYHDDIRFVFTSRDRSISMKKYFDNRENYSERDYEKYIQVLHEMIDHVSSRNVPSHFFSYESFLVYGERYLQTLYAFLDCKSEFSPESFDANAKYIVTGSVKSQD